MKLPIGIETHANRSDFIRLKRAVGLLLCAVMVAGCGIRAHDYSWAPYAIDPALVVADGSALDGQTVSITHEGNEGENMMIGELGNHQYFGSSEQLADAISVQLSDELKRLNMSVSGGGTKTLNIKVSHPATERGMWVIRAHFRVIVETGNGYVFEKSISNATPMTVPRAFNGAVALAVIDILNDPQIVAYLGS